MAEAEARAHVIVRGRVQGVGFRAFVLRNARALGVAGGVRNEVDGSLTTVATGAESALEQFRSRLSVGPPGSQVTAVEEATLAGMPAESFDVRF